ncbi:hypothetical protein VT52_029910 [Streptomyces malaysiense]|uniref:Uncharacterized protein n=1 Tax=Streptomyces malaysiense TaxID=1428626 RepID=A0A1J4PSZ1_9ACTN|nr:hypothetical protein VT52_029910 [Streptomyces malaysiense]
MFAMVVTRRPCGARPRSHEAGIRGIDTMDTIRSNTPGNSVVASAQTTSGRQPNNSMRSAAIWVKCASTSMVVTRLSPSRWQARAAL